MLRTDLIASIPDLLRRHAKARGGKLAFRDARGSVTYAELEARTGRIAGHLADHGIDAGDTVAMLLPNSVTWVEASFAITRAGAIGVPINYDSTEAEISYRLTDANCKAIVATAERAPLVAKLRSGAPNLQTTVFTGDGGTAARLAKKFIAATATGSVSR